MKLEELDKIYEGAHEEALAAFGTMKNPVTAAAVDNAHREGLKRVVLAVIDACANAADDHGFSSEVGTDPLTCQGCGEEVAANLRLLKTTV